MSWSWIIYKKGNLIFLKMDGANFIFNLRKLEFIKHLVNYLFKNYINHVFKAGLNLIFEYHPEEILSKRNDYVMTYDQYLKYPDPKFLNNQILRTAIQHEDCSLFKHFDSYPISLVRNKSEKILTEAAKYYKDQYSFAKLSKLHLDCVLKNSRLTDEQLLDFINEGNYMQIFDLLKDKSKGYFELSKYINEQNYQTIIDLIPDYFSNYNTYKSNLGSFETKFVSNLRSDNFEECQKLAKFIRPEIPLKLFNKLLEQDDRYLIHCCTISKFSYGKDYYDFDLRWCRVKKEHQLYYKCQKYFDGRRKSVSEKLKHGMNPTKWNHYTFSRDFDISKIPLDIKNTLIRFYINGYCNTYHIHVPREYHFGWAIYTDYEIPDFDMIIERVKILHKSGCTVPDFYKPHLEKILKSF